jgi:hypothetical protein
MEIVNILGLYRVLSQSGQRPSRNGFEVVAISGFLHLEHHIRKLPATGEDRWGFIVPKSDPTAAAVLAHFRQ